jgi:hypothetical protein
MPQQPNFTVKSNAIQASEYDNLSNEDLQKLINAAHKAKTGREGHVRPVVAPPQKQHVDIDRLIELSKAGKL